MSCPSFPAFAFSAAGREIKAAVLLPMGLCSSGLTQKVAFETSRKSFCFSKLMITFSAISFFLLLLLLKNGPYK